MAKALVLNNVGVTAGTQLMVGTVPRNGNLHLVYVTAAAGAAATLTLYDNTSATGTILAMLNAPVSQTYGFDYDGLTFSIGLFAVVTGTGARAFVTYE